MVDISSKDGTKRTAVAQAIVNLGPNVFQKLQQNLIKKGDALTVAHIAGISAAKLTSNLIPLCHNIPLQNIDITFTLESETNSVKILAHVKTVGKTGAEMEALVASSVAALNIYDMCKALSKEIIISDVKLISKTGGKRGDYNV